MQENVILDIMQQRPTEGIRIHILFENSTY